MKIKILLLILSLASVALAGDDDIQRRTGSPNLVRRDLGITQSGATGTTFTAETDGGYTIVLTHAAFTDLDEEQTISLATFPANVELDSVDVVLDAKFTGGGITSFDAEVQDSLTPTGYTTNGLGFNIFSGTIATVVAVKSRNSDALTSAEWVEVHSASHTIDLIGYCDGAHDVADATAGQMTIHFTVSKRQ